MSMDICGRRRSGGGMRYYIRSCCRGNKGCSDSNDKGDRSGNGCLMVDIASRVVVM